MSRQITVRIARDGTVTADTHGFSGVECLQHVEQLERLLEARAVESEFTSPGIAHGEAQVQTQVRQAGD